MFVNFLAASTHDQEVFSFYPDGRPCDGFEEALRRYREIVPNLRLAGESDSYSVGCGVIPSCLLIKCTYTVIIGPTSFAPIIETAIGIADSTGGQYHVLLIIADGQVRLHFVFLIIY